MEADPIKILILGRESRLGVARLPRALQLAGFRVAVACPPDNYLATTRFREALFVWPGNINGSCADYLKRLKQIVSEWQPDFLIAADELTVLFLSLVFKKLKRTADPLAALLKHSLGNPLSLVEAVSKHRTLERARQLEIRCPAGCVVSSQHDVRNFSRKNSFPILLKQSFSWGGQGVVVCRNEPEALAQWEKWHRRPLWKQKFYDWRNRLRGRDANSSWLPVGRTVAASEFITGTPAMCLVVAFEGRVLAGLTARKEQSFPNALGPSSVVRFVRNTEMRRAAEKLIRFWGLSGFIGFDFILDAEERAWLIECNPRPTPLGHLGARAGEDLCQALFCGLTGQTPPLMNQVADLLVAHFPNELQRDPASRYLTDAFCDVPTDDPDLLERLWPQLKN